MQRILLMAVGICTFGSRHLDAQHVLETRQVAADVRVVQAGALAGKSSVLDAVISIELKDASLAQALREIGKQSGVRVSLSEAVFSASGRVNYVGSGVSVRDVLDRVLAKTNVAYKEISGREIVFTKRLGQGDVSEGVIVGKVLHAKTKQPVAGVTVTLGDTDKQAVTGPDGSFRLAVPAGEQTIRIRIVGFQRQSRTVTVTPEGAQTVEILLEPSASVLDEVVVTGSVVATERRAIATPITVITARDIEQRGITRLDQLFRGEVPGVVAMDVGVTEAYGAVGGMARTQVYSRGTSSMNGSPNPLKTYVDGVEMVDPNYLGTINPGTIERIEIISGPQAATIYGSGAMGGVMMIFTKRGSALQPPDITLGLKYGVLESNLSQGKTPSHNHTLSLNGDAGTGFRYSGNLIYGYTGQWQPGLYNRNVSASVGAVHTKGPVTINANINGTGGQSGTIASYLEGGVVAAYEADRGEWDVSRGVRPKALVRQSSTMSGFITGLNFDHRIQSWWSHRATLGRSSTRFALVPHAPQYTSPSDTIVRNVTIFGERTNAAYDMSMNSRPVKWASASLTAGVNGSWGWTYTMDGYLNLMSSTTWSNPSVRQTMDDQTWGAFTQLRIGVWDRFFIPIGFRIEQSPQYGTRHKFDWTPTSGLAYSFDIDEVTVKLMGSYGRATRAPEPGLKLEQWRVEPNVEPQRWLGRLPNPDLRPEYSRGPQGGVELYWGNLGSFTVNHYQQRVEGLIQQLRVDSFEITVVSTGQTLMQPIFQYQNVGILRQTGWDGTASLNLWRFGMKGTYSWTDSRIQYTDGGLAGFLYGSVIVGSPSHAGNVNVTYAYGKTNVFLGVNWIGQMYVRDATANLQGEYATNSSQARLKMYVTRANWPLTNRKIGYAKANFTVSHNISQRLSLSARIDNLGNSYSSERGMNSPSLGRTTQMGLVYRWLR